MELKSLSSNWKKLQGTLRKKDVSATSTTETTKRKRSEREPQKNDTVKKRKVVAEGIGKRTVATSGPVSRDRKKRMLQEVTNGGGGEDVETVVKAAVSRVNEGRASKFVHTYFCYWKFLAVNGSVTNSV
jgi:RNA exonuclease 4